MSAQDLAIDVKGLSKSFDGRKVVDAVDIEVRRGEICGFLGPNGSGKTTTIRMLCGLLEPDAGEGTCLGFDIRRETRRIKLRVGYMTQKFGLYDDLSIEENLDFVARVYRTDDRAQVVRKTLERLGLTERRKQLAGSLSGGWKQRLALAACLLHTPDLLLLDEPTAGVDPKARREFWEQIHRLAAEGLTFLITTHYMDEAERCHRLAYIAYGRLLTHGTVSEVIAHAHLTTWSVSGPDLHRLAEELRTHPGVRQAVAFGNRLHVSSDDPAALEAAIARFRTAPYDWREVNSGLEEVFIHLMNQAPDNFRPS
jgi:ABC-2 type transport system ATP-binding protein